MRGRCSGIRRGQREESTRHNGYFINTIGQFCLETLSHPVVQAYPQGIMIQRESRLLNDLEGHGMPLAILYMGSE
jgi:hypothetical protein